MLRLSLSVRLFVWISVLVIGVAALLIGLDVAKLVYGQMASDSPVATGLVRLLTAETIFAYIGKATTLVGGILALVRYWVYAEDQLPKRILDRIDSFQIASSETRQGLLAGLETAWAAAPSEKVARVEWARERSRLVTLEANKSAATANQFAPRIEELKASLSQQSFDKASYHLARGLEYQKFADAGLGVDLRRKGAEELTRAAELDRDVVTARRDVRIYQALFKSLDELQDRDSAISVARDWADFATDAEAKRDEAEARYELSRLLYTSAPDAPLVSTHDALIDEAREEIERAIALLTSLNSRNDLLRARSHELLADVTKVAGLAQMPLNNYWAALDIFTACDSDSGVARVAKKLEETGVVFQVPQPSNPEKKVIEAQILLGRSLAASGCPLDAQSVLYRAKRHLDRVCAASAISNVDRAILESELAVAQQAAAIAPPTEVKHPR